jgi:hypothetical protein
MPKSSGQKIKLKQQYAKITIKGNVTAIVWKDKQSVNILTNMHCPPAAEGNFRDDHENGLK